MFTNQVTHSANRTDCPHNPGVSLSPCDANRLSPHSQGTYILVGRQPVIINSMEKKKAEEGGQGGGAAVCLGDHEGPQSGCGSQEGLSGAGHTDLTV